MKHTLLYRGRLSLNLDELAPDTQVYVKPDGTKAPNPVPSASADGIPFGYMEKLGQKFFAVSVGSVILDVPVLLVPSKHCDGKAFGPSASLFGDESARRLIADAIRVNPQQAEEVLEEVWRVIEGLQPL